MSIRHGLLALLTEAPKYGYQLRAEFEQRTGSTWPLNVGQVYTTLGRLERDGLVAAADSDAEGRLRYAITNQGRSEVARWFAAPVPRDAAPRDELAIKLSLALTLPGVDVPALVQTQRRETMRTLQNYTRLKQHSGDAEIAWSLALDAMLFQAEAELRWLDHCEERLVGRPRPASGAGADEPSAVEPSAVEPSAVEPSAVEPGAVEPGAVEPSAVEPGAADVIDPAGVGR